MGITSIEERLNELQRESQTLQDEAAELAKEVQFKYNRMQAMQVEMFKLEGRIQEVSGMLAQAKNEETCIVTV